MATIGDTVLEYAQMRIIADGNISGKVRDEAMTNRLNEDTTLQQIEARIEDIIQTKSLKFDLIDFWCELEFLIIQGSFQDEELSNNLIDYFHSLEIDVPKWVENCHKEVTKRTELIDSLFENKRYWWMPYKAKSYTDDLKKELNYYTVDEIGKIDFLRKALKEQANKIKESEQNFADDYSYGGLSSIYDNLSFVAEKEDINELFYYSQWHKRTCSVMSDIWLRLLNYIDCINKVILLRDELGVQSIFQFEKENENTFNKKLGYQEIKGHFVELTKLHHGKDLKPFLDDKDLEKFIKAAFYGVPISGKIEMHYEPNVQTKIVTNIFWGFYQLCKEKGYAKKRGDKTKYVKLLSDHFVGFKESTVSANFKSLSIN
jgi:hypothetical protein